MENQEALYLTLIEIIEEYKKDVVITDKEIQKVLDNLINYYK